MWLDVLIGFNSILISNISPDEPWGRSCPTPVHGYAGSAGPEPLARWQDWAAALKQVYPD